MATITITPTFKQVITTRINNKQEILDTLRNIPEEYYKQDNPKANLHIHSTYSDGRLNVNEIIEQAVQKKKKYISITDHDTTEHLKEVEKYNKYLIENGLTVISGVELSTKNKGKNVHILVYGADYNDKRLNKICNDIKNGKKVDTIKAIKELSKDYVTVLAHPIYAFNLGLKKMIMKFKEAGLSGIEVYYPYNDTDKYLKLANQKGGFIYKNLAKIRETIVKPEEFAKKTGLIATGGKDTHNKNLDYSY